MKLKCTLLLCLLTTGLVASAPEAWPQCPAKVTSVQWASNVPGVRSGDNTELTTVVTGQPASAFVRRTDLPAPPVSIPRVADIRIKFDTSGGCYFAPLVVSSNKPNLVKVTSPEDLGEELEDDPTYTLRSVRVVGVPTQETRVEISLTWTGVRKLFWTLKPVPPAPLPYVKSIRTIPRSPVAGGIAEFEVELQRPLQPSDGPVTLYWRLNPSDQFEQSPGQAAYSTTGTQNAHTLTVGNTVERLIVKVKPRAQPIPNASIETWVGNRNSTLAPDYFSRTFAVTAGGT